MQARVKQPGTTENDGLSPPSAARCRCPRPKRGDGFTLCCNACANKAWRVVLVCGWLTAGRAWRDQGERPPVGSRPAVATPAAGESGLAGRLAGRPEGRTGRGSPALLLLHPSRPRLFRWAPWRRWAYHEVMAGDLVTVSALPPLLLRSAAAGSAG